MRRTAASARAGRVSTVGTGGAWASRAGWSRRGPGGAVAGSGRAGPGTDRAAPTEPSPAEPSPSRSPAKPPSAPNGPRWWPDSPGAPARPALPAGSLRPRRVRSCRPPPRPPRTPPPQRRAARRGGGCAGGARTETSRPGEPPAARPARAGVRVRGREGHAVGVGLSCGEVGRGGAVHPACPARRPRPSHPPRRSPDRRWPACPSPGRPPSDVLLRHGSGGRLPAGSLCRVSSSLTVLLPCPRTGSAPRLGGPGERAVRQLWNHSGRRARSPSVLPR